MAGALFWIGYIRLMGNLHNFEPERSSQVAHLAYDPDTKHLHVRFKPKSDKKKDEPRTYIYEGVPPNVFAAMTRHPSTGEYFHRVIKKHYKLV
jgi:hypothetical protein